MSAELANLEQSLNTPTNYADKSGVQLEEEGEQEQLSRSDPPVMEPAISTGSRSRADSPIDASIYDKMTVNHATVGSSADPVPIAKGVLANLIRGLTYSYKSAEALRMIVGVIIEGFHMQGIRQIKPGFAKSISSDMLKTAYADVGAMSSVRPQALINELTVSRKDGKLLDVLYEHTLTTYLELLQQISCFKNARDDIITVIPKVMNIDTTRSMGEVVEEVVKLQGIPDYSDGKFILPAWTATNAAATLAPAAISAMDVVRASDDVAGNIAGIKQENEILRATIATLKNELTEKSNAATVSRGDASEVERLRAEIEKLRERNIKLKNIADDAKAETAATRTSNASLRQQLEALKSEAANKASEDPCSKSAKSDRGPSRPRSQTSREASQLLTTADLTHTGARSNGPPSHAAARQHRPARPTSAANQRIITGKVAPARVEINNSSHYAIHGKSGELNNTGVPAVSARVVKRSVAAVDNCLVCIGPRSVSAGTRFMSPEKHAQNTKAASPEARKPVIVPVNSRTGKGNSLCDSYYSYQNTVTTPSRKVASAAKATPRRPASTRATTSSARTPSARARDSDPSASQLGQSRGPTKMNASVLPADATSRTPKARVPVDDLYNQIDRLSVELAAEKDKRRAILEENRSLKATLTTMERQTRQQMNNIESKYRAVLEHTVKKLTSRA